MGILSVLPGGILPRKIRTCFDLQISVIYAVLLWNVVFFETCGVGVVAVDDKNGESVADNNAENPVSQVRYRSRPVAAFRSGPKATNNGTTNSSETDIPEPSGVPFIAVHDLTSQTFEKLQENWKNLETFIRNLQARRSQEESLRSPSPSGGASSGDRDTVRRPPYNNVYTFKYHPVVIQGEGSANVDDTIGGNARGVVPPRPFNGVSFNPFPFDPKGEGSKDVDMERHTVATIYTIGICLTIMAIGSVMFILINKCDGSGGNYMRTSGASGAGSRITRSVIGAAAARGGRQVGSSSNNNGRSRNNRGGRSSSNNESSQSASSTANIRTSSVDESNAKNLTDLPPSYASLFPEGGPKSPQAEPSTTSTAAVNISSVIHEGATLDSNLNENSRPPGPSSTEN